jgi:DNA primase
MVPPATENGRRRRARAYLARRGLDEAAQERWEIGFAPDSLAGPATALKGKGMAPDLIVAGGLCAKPEKGGAPYDRFRGRIIFPIRDARGRCDQPGRPGDGSECPRQIPQRPGNRAFRQGPQPLQPRPRARGGGQGQALIVAEGYMDVIALSEAGFTGAVAPLGTAITEDQLRLMWRLHDEPIIALDGDAAGIRAACG